MKDNVESMKNEKIKNNNVMVRMNIGKEITKEQKISRRTLYWNQNHT